MNPPKPEKVEVTDFKSAVRGLVDRELLNSRHYKATKANALVAQGKYLSPQLLDFYGRLQRKLARVGIPVVLGYATYDVAFIEHARRRGNLHPKEWQVIAHYGMEIARQYALEVRWGGLMMPRTWLGTSAGSI